MSRNRPTANSVRYGAAGGYQKLLNITSLIFHAFSAQVQASQNMTVMSGKKRKMEQTTFISAFHLGDNML